MTEDRIPHPHVVSRDEWLVKRKILLGDEKALTRRMVAVNARRRRLPMVKLDKDYIFQGPEGDRRLRDLFEGCRQLIVYHFMFDPEWHAGCGGCTGLVNALGDLGMLNERDTAMVLASRAPLEKLEAYRKLKGWTLPWYSAHGGYFNHDFHVTLDEAVAQPEYNYRRQAELTQHTGEPYFMSRECHGLSVFFRTGDEVFHTYSTYARGCEGLTNVYSLLDRTPYGRQEEFEDSPSGCPRSPPTASPN